MVNASPARSDESSLAELAAVADVVIANESEASEWPWQPTYFVVTLGARGARYVGPDGEFGISAPAVSAVDTTGAGDVFAGVLAAHWPCNRVASAAFETERRRALQRACAAGALATLVPGAGDCAPDVTAIDAAERNG
jgi:ribokinase